MSFPKKGKFFPRRTPQSSGRPGAGRFPSEIAGALKRSARINGTGVKVVAGWTGANEKTVKNWFAGRYGPSGEHLVILIRQSDEILNAILKLAGREELVVSLKLSAAEAAIQDVLVAIRDIPRRGKE